MIGFKLAVLPERRLGGSQIEGLGQCDAISASVGSHLKASGRKKSRTSFIPRLLATSTSRGRGKAPHSPWRAPGLGCLEWKSWKRGLPLGARRRHLANHRKQEDAGGYLDLHAPWSSSLREAGDARPVSTRDRSRTSMWVDEPAASMRRCQLFPRSRFQGREDAGRHADRAAARRRADCPPSIIPLCWTPSHSASRTPLIFSLLCSSAWNRRCRGVDG